MAQDPTGVRYRGDPQIKDERIGAIFPERYLFNTNHPEVFKAYIGGTQDAKDDEILKFLYQRHIWYLVQRLVQNHHNLPSMDEPERTQNKNLQLDYVAQRKQS